MCLWAESLHSIISPDNSFILPLHCNPILPYNHISLSSLVTTKILRVYRLITKLISTVILMVAVKASGRQETNHPVIRYVT